MILIQYLLLIVTTYLQRRMEPGLQIFLAVGPGTKNTGTRVLWKLKGMNNTGTRVLWKLKGMKNTGTRVLWKLKGMKNTGTRVLRKLKGMKNTGQEYCGN